ncbi:MAG: phage tail terminator-like protein [Aurantimicrobium sp.]|uniref:phage tail terminator-like protein n=1 Tax=Aurantimicrobium sp. TaxID=1930784 RepID=UPI002FC74A9E
MSNKEIRKAFEIKLSEYITTKRPTLKVSWENRSFSVTGVEKYLQPVLYPAGLANPSLGDIHKRYYGTFVVRIKDSLLNRGTDWVDEVSKEIEDWFPRGMILTNEGNSVWIQNDPYSHYVDLGDKWLTVMVEIPYRSDYFKQG